MKFHDIRGNLQYYYDFIVKTNDKTFYRNKDGKIIEQTLYKLHFHTFENEAILNLWLYITDAKIVDSLEYLSNKCDPIENLNITAYIRNFEDCMIYRR